MSDRPESERRGKGFPKIPLESSVKVIQEASKVGTAFKRPSFATFGLKKGKGSAKSGAFKDRIAALQDFGLIEQRHGEIKLTELALQITRPTPGDNPQIAIREAFLSCEVFRRLYEEASKGVALDPQAVANVAVRESGLAPSASERFIKSFIASGEFAGLLQRQNGHILLGDLAANEDSTPESDQEQAQSEQATPAYRLSGQPTLYQRWGNGESQSAIELLIYADRPLKGDEFALLAEISAKLEELEQQMSLG